jgi:methylenetetrahydrofolate--tRNA-(uracil-5-)-methyltransferase
MAYCRLTGKSIPAVPPETAHGALVRHITGTESKHFQPSNINFGLLPVPDEALKVRDKKLKRKMVVERALDEWERYLKQIP